MRVETKYYEFHQNNSGGYFIEDEENGIGSELLIEAHSAEEAKGIFYKIGEKRHDFNDYCSCCGERWSPQWVDEGDGEIFPHNFGKPLGEKGLFRDHVYIHRLDGTIERVELT